MFNLFFKFNREYVHKKIVIQNLNISEDKTEKHIEDYKNSFTLGQLFLNPNSTGMSWLLNSTGMCVLSITQFCVALLLRKVGMPVQLVVFCRCTRGGGSRVTVYIVYRMATCTQRLLGQRGLLFQKKKQ